jgi:hypothetical protein
LGSVGDGLLALSPQDRRHNGIEQSRRLSNVETWLNTQ